MAVKTLRLNQQFGGPQCWPVFCDMDSAVSYSLEVHSAILCSAIWIVLWPTVWRSILAIAILYSVIWVVPCPPGTPVYRRINCPFTPVPTNNRFSIHPLCQCVPNTFMVFTCNWLFNSLLQYSRIPPRLRKHWSTADQRLDSDLWNWMLAVILDQIFFFFFFFFQWTGNFFVFCFSIWATWALQTSCAKHQRGCSMQQTS